MTVELGHFALFRMNAALALVLWSAPVMAWETEVLKDPLLDVSSAFIWHDAPGQGTGLSAKCWYRKSGETLLIVSPGQFYDSGRSQDLVTVTLRTDRHKTMQIDMVPTNSGGTLRYMAPVKAEPEILVFLGQIAAAKEQVVFSVDGMSYTLSTSGTAKAISTFSEVCNLALPDLVR